MLARIMLAIGEPVLPVRVAQHLELFSNLVREVLNSWPAVCLDDDHNVVGFWGVPTKNSVHVVNIELIDWLPTFAKTLAGCGSSNVGRENGALFAAEIGGEKRPNNDCSQFCSWSKPPVSTSSISYGSLVCSPTYKSRRICSSV